jgi:hypothetical protein
MKGASSSCVVDLERRIIGIIHNVNRAGSGVGMEIRYVEPVEWMLENVKDGSKIVVAA